MKTTVKLLTRKEMARELRVSQPTLDAQVRDGMPHIKIGKQYLFDYTDVITWLKSRSQSELKD